MKYKIRQLAILIIISLLSTIALQIYYVLEIYQQKSSFFHDEVNQAFEKAVAKTNEQRLREINTYFERDIKDTTQVKLEYKVTEDGPRLMVIDPKTGYKHLSMSIESNTDSLLDYPSLIRMAVDKNWKLLKDESILYWTQTIGDRLKIYSDTLSISEEVLKKNMKSELLKYGIQEEFKFIKSDSSYQYDSTDRSFRIKMLPVKLEGETLLTAKIDNPEMAILKRAVIIFSLTIIALAFLFASFIYLYTILKKQKQISELKDDFIDNITHELITPTATLKLALETLEKTVPSSSENYINVAKQHANRIESIVDQVLKSSLSQSNRYKTSFEKCDMLTALREIVDYYQATCGEKVAIKMAVENPVQVITYKEHFTTALHNIISNAVKYGNPARPEIIINLHTSEQSHLLCIKDNGNGIPESHQPLIFEKFHRVPSLTHDVKGLGIGLYHAKMLMQQINGDIYLKYSSKHGSCFCIELKNTNE